MTSRFLFLGAVVLAAAARLVAADRPVQFDPAQSTVDVVVKATVDSFTGRLAAYELTGTVDEQGRFRSARLTFRFRDVLTGKPKRDAKMHEWQGTAQFPDARFELVSLTDLPDATCRAAGRLTFHGVTREVSFPVRIGREGDVHAIDGEAAIDTRDFGLPVIRLIGVLKVDPVVRVRFHFQGKAA
jgi:polyisoprenoid-binding protein YceI